MKVRQPAAATTQRRKRRDWGVGCSRGPISAISYMGAGKIHNDFKRLKLATWGLHHANGNQLGTVPALLM